MTRCTVLRKLKTYLVLYLFLLMFLFYESKIKPELGTVKKQTLIVLYIDSMCY